MANEKRLIERIAERLKDAYPQADRNNLCPAIYYDDFADIVDEVLAEVEDSVDAVEVVRCKKCRFCKKHPTSDKVKMCTNEQQWVTEYYPIVHDDDFCSYGERKDGDGNG